MRPRGAAAPLALLALASACGGAPRGPCEPDPPSGSLGSVCGFENPEDVEFVGAAGVLLVSEMRRGDAGGSLAALPLDPMGRSLAAPRRIWPAEGRTEPDGRGEPACPGPPEAALFSPHGLNAGPSRNGRVPVAVVNHGGRESVELFDLEGHGSEVTLVWRGCVPMPADTSGNDVALGAGASLAVSNPLPTSHGARAVWSQILSGLGRTTGDVLLWDRERGWSRIPGSHAAYPNGIAWAGDAVLLAETGAGAVRRAWLAAQPPADDASAPAGSIEIEGRPDNLAWNADGSLLVVTHLAAGELLACRLSGGPCRSPWALLEIDPDLSSVAELVRHDGEVVGAASSAAQAVGRIYLGAVFGDRIGVLRLAD